MKLLVCKSDLETLLMMSMSITVITFYAMLEAVGWTAVEFTDMVSPTID